MKSVFSEFYDLWPDSSHAALKPMLSKIGIFYYPAEKSAIVNCGNLNEFIIVVAEGTVNDILQAVALGAEHCVQKGRPDFAQELLASALMVSRPAAFKNNPIPFFFTGFSLATDISTETNLSIPFRKTSDKSYLLERLSTFLSQNAKLEGLSDICVQVADELISNALFSAPVDAYGVHMNQNVDRNTEILLPEEMKATFFSCFSDYRVVIGCEDRFGSFKKKRIVDHLKSSFLNSQARARSGESAGAGLGFRYIIENSANFYLYCDRGERSLVAAGFLLKGLKANLTAQKHFHMSLK
jgi:hypothetical protein